MEKNQTRKPETKDEKEFSKKEVAIFAALLAAGIIGEGNDECVEEAMKLPLDLQHMLAISIIKTKTYLMKKAILSNLSNLN